MSGLRRVLGGTCRWAGYLLAALLVLMAAVGAAGWLLLPLAERHSEWVSQWLAERTGHAVALDRIETEWTRRGPLLRLDGLRIGDGADAVRIGAAEVLVSQYSGLLPGRSLTELRLRELALELDRDARGRWSVQGLPGQQQAGGDPLSMLERLGELQVIDGSLRINAPDLGVQARLPGVDLRLRVDAHRVRAAVRVRPGEGEGTPLHGALELDRDSGDGHAFAGGSEVDLAGWGRLLSVEGVTMAGHGRARAWATLHDMRVEEVEADLGLAAVRVERTTSAAAFDQIAGRLRWLREGSGWRVDVPGLEFEVDGRRHALESVAFAWQGPEQLALAADRLEPGPALQLLGLSDRSGAGLRNWLQAAGPELRLRDVDVVVDHDNMRLDAQVDALGFAPVGDYPGLEGLRGHLVGDGRGILFEIDPEAPLRLDWPSGFGVMHEFGARGEVVAWREDGGWQLQAPSLRVNGQGYAADIRGGLFFRSGAGRPVIDMAARLDPAQVVVANGFWVRHEMPPASVEWLEAALRGGVVRNARALVSGDLDDWPFRAGQGQPAKGLFLAEGELDGARLRFQPDWPEAEKLDGWLRFSGSGFQFRGTGTLAGVELSGVEAGIDDFAHAQLRVRARTQDDAGRVLGLLRHSPIASDHAEALAPLQARGAVAGGFEMLLPLHDDHNIPRIAGTVALEDVALADTQWDIALDRVHGVLRYDQHGFSTDELAARHDGQPAALSLRAGEGHVRDAAHAFEARLEARMDTGELPARVPELAWLGPHLTGRSLWTIGLDVPAAAGSVPVLRLRSNLVGSALGLPAPLAKVAPVQLPTLVEVSTLDDGHLVHVEMGQRLSLQARSDARATGVSVALGGAAASPPPPSGLQITGQAPALDLVDWVALATGGAGGDDGLALQRVDLDVDSLQLLGGAFRSVHMRALPAGNAIALAFSGPDLEGRLSLPQGGGAITGHLQRMHWRGRAGTTAKGPGESPAADDNGLLADSEGTAGPDPATLPAITLSVDELQVQDAHLGHASLRTRPVAGGLLLEELSTGGGPHRISATGSWSGRGPAARSRLVLEVSSSDFGGLVAGVGQGDHLRGGNGTLDLEAAWPGSPLGFDSRAVAGELSLRIKDGQLVEVEPGAGRVLGMLSLAEIPRRLTLDFRDLFARGFAFNRIGGKGVFGDGVARTDDLRIDGPAAEIRIAGTADLRTQHHDQTIEVYPRSGNLLTAVGAIAGGPVGAAVGAMANAVLHKPLGEIAATTYRVTGPWKDPEVEVVRSTASTAAPSAPPPPATTDPGSPGVSGPR